MKAQLLSLMLSGATLLPFNSAKSQNNCLNFDGNDDVAITYDPALDFTSTDVFSIEAWFKTTSYTAVIFSNHVDLAPFPGYEIAIVNGKAVFEILKDHITDAIRIETTAFYNDGNWHHMAVVYNGIPNATTVKFYVDGVIQTVVNTSNNLTSAVNTGNEPHIGSRDNTTYFFNGNIDEVRIWGRALCGDEIVAHKNCQLSGSEPGLLAYYNFNQGTAGGANSSTTNLPDLSPLSNPGTLSGFMLSGSTSNWVTSNPVIIGNCGSFSVPYIIPLSVSGKTLTCKNAPLTLTVSGATNYTWMPGNLSGPQVTVAPSATTSYTVTGFGPGGCKASGVRTQTVSDCTGIENVNNDAYVTIFPNPGSGLLSLAGTKPGDLIEVYSSLGMMIVRTFAETEKSTLDISDQSDGIYLLKITSGEKVYLHRYLKE